MINSTGGATTIHFGFSGSRSYFQNNANLDAIIKQHINMNQNVEYVSDSGNFTSTVI